MGRKTKFPDPTKSAPANPAVLCPAARVLALYNEAHPPTKNAKKIGKTVIPFSDHEAVKAAIAGVDYHG